jgi:rare lipoprotein A
MRQISKIVIIFLFFLVSCAEIRRNERSRYSRGTTNNNNRYYKYQKSSDNEDIPKNKKYIGYYKIGNPYKIDGKTYYPKEDRNYKKTGYASWYGDDFHNKKTANGEIFNMNDMTAAHKTLPLPSIVKVTNLENGKSVVVRVNDRGPFVDDRIIDLSKKAAEKLDARNKGIFKVKVEFLKKETDKMLKTYNLKK